MGYCQHSAWQGLNGGRRALLQFRKVPNIVPNKEPMTLQLCRKYTLNPKYTHVYIYTYIYVCAYIYIYIPH